MKLDFKKALKKIVSEELRGSNPVPDILGFLHVEALLKPDFYSELERLFSRYLEGDCETKALLRIDMPKGNFTIRPMSRPVMEDWVIFEAIVDHLARKILSKNRKICKRSYSIRNFKKDGIRSTNAWLQFDERSRSFYERGYRVAVVTDITGYYENINLDELRKRIIDYLGRDKNGQKVTKIILSQLRVWSDERISGYGLPQGPPGSSFLADIFLDYVDSRMEKYKGYFRYMDDIRIFCKSDIRAKLALKELTIALRRLKLNINAKKTDILHGKEIEERLFDPQKSLLNVIEMTIKSGNKKLIRNIIPDLVKLVFHAFLDDPFEKTHLNFALYRLSILYNSGFGFNTDRIVEKIEENLVTKPHHTGLFCDFLSMFPDNEDIPMFLMEFLQSKNNIYEGQELKILRCLLRLDFRASRQEIDHFLASARDSNKHFAIRGFYFLLVGKYGNNRDRNLIIEEYDNLSELYTKMSVILATQELGRASRNDFYARVKRREKESRISELIDYVKSLSQPTYFLTTKRPRIETLEEYEEDYDGYYY